MPAVWQVPTHFRLSPYDPLGQTAIQYFETGSAKEPEGQVETHFVVVFYP